MVYLGSYTLLLPPPMAGLIHFLEAYLRALRNSGAGVAANLIQELFKVKDFRTQDENAIPHGLCYHLQRTPSSQLSG